MMIGLIKHTVSDILCIKEEWCIHIKMNNALDAVSVTIVDLDIKA